MYTHTSNNNNVFNFVFSPATIVKRNAAGGNSYFVYRDGTRNKSVGKDIYLSETHRYKSLQCCNNFQSKNMASTGDIKTRRY